MLRWLMVGAVLWIGCEDKPAPKSSGASHWLSSCATDADCGALACLCGQCSAACDVAPDACPVGICVADACGGEAICRAASADADQANEFGDLQMDGPGDDAWANGPAVDADNPRGVWQFHRPSIIDGNVLELRSDGTFVYTFGGCDAVECAWGRWQSVGEDATGRIRLRPPEGEIGFRWPDEFALETVSGVELSPTSDGIAARVTAPDRAAFDQDWLPRGLAVDCVDWSVSLSDAPAESQHCSAPAFPEE